MNIEKFKEIADKKLKITTTLFFMTILRLIFLFIIIPNIRKSSFANNRREQIFVDEFIKLIEGKQKPTQNGKGCKQSGKQFAEDMAIKIGNALRNVNYCATNNCQQSFERRFGEHGKTDFEILPHVVGINANCRDGVTKNGKNYQQRNRNGNKQQPRNHARRERGKVISKNTKGINHPTNKCQERNLPDVLLDAFEKFRANVNVLFPRVLPNNAHRSRKRDGVN